jgi:hypothetical protein
MTDTPIWANFVFFFICLSLSTPHTWHRWTYYLGQTTAWTENIKHRLIFLVLPIWYLGPQLFSCYHNVLYICGAFFVTMTPHNFPVKMTPYMLLLFAFARQRQLPPPFLNCRFTSAWVSKYWCRIWTQNVSWIMMISIMWSSWLIQDWVISHSKTKHRWHAWNKMTIDTVCRVNLTN